MNNRTFRVLLIEDSPGDVDLTRAALQKSLAPLFLLTHVARLDDGLEKLLQADFDVAVLDLALPDSHGLETFFTVRDHAGNIPIVILTGLLDDDLAVRAFQEGVAECLPKSYLHNGELSRALHYAIERTRVQQPQIRQETRSASCDRLTPDMFGYVDGQRVVVASTLPGSPPPKDLGKLQASEVRYRRLFETAQDGILILDAETGRIADVNPFLLNLLGFTYEEVIGQTVGALSPFRDLVANQAMLTRLQQHGYVRYENLPMETKDGRSIAVEFVSNAYQAAKSSVIQCNVRDITERKQMEDRMQQLKEELEVRVADRTAELQSLNVELEAFSYSVSHDLRAPLRHIMGFVDLLQQEIAGSLSEKNLHYLKTIAASAERMGCLIDNLLDFARVGRTELKKSDVDLEQLVKETVEGFGTETKARNIVWEISALPPVWADPFLLRLVLVNLLSNAVKFTSPRAEPKIEIGCMPNGSRETKIFIRDNGVGFDPKYTDKLFGVFQRLHSTAEFEGTGIGLANVQRIILRHGGKIWGNGAVDAGATFSFSLPAQ